MLKFSWGVIVVFMPLICSNEVFGLGIYVGILNKIIHSFLILDGSTFFLVWH